MQNRIIKISLLFVLVAAIATEADAQRTPRRRTNTQSNPPPAETQQTNDTRQPSGYNPYGNVPIEQAAPAEGGYNDSAVNKSLRPDGAFDKSFVNERTPLPYEHLRVDDALFAEKSMA